MKVEIFRKGSQKEVQKQIESKTKLITFDLQGFLRNKF